MTVVAVIPARGGSVGVPRKNLQRVGGVPLIGRAVTTARSIDSIDLVVVSSDDREILETGMAFGAIAVERPSELSGGEATSESALLHALDALDALDAGSSEASILVFIQATSPFIDRRALAEAIERVASGAVDVAFSACASHSFLWRVGDGRPSGVNHQESARLRRQDREAEYRETGAFYVLRASGFRHHRHRFFGTLGIVETPPESSIEIDDPMDLEAARSLAHLFPLPGDRIRARALVTDFDGVHTDDRVYVDQDGRETVRVHRGDGMGVSRLRSAGVPMLILSTERNPVVQARAAKLEVECIASCDGKLDALVAWAERRGVPLSEIAYVGNDVNDLDCLRAVGWPVVVGSAPPEVTAEARVVLGRGGGEGAVREVCERILAARSECMGDSAHVD